MTARTPGGDAVDEILHGALAPYPWRHFTPELVARLVVAAHDRVDLGDLLGAVPGTTVGPWARLVPAAPEDPRLAPLLACLARHRWKRLRLGALCRTLVEAFAAQPA